MKAPHWPVPHFELVAAVIRRPRTSTVDLFVGGTLRATIDLPSWPPKLEWVDAIERKLARLVAESAHGAN